MTVVSEFLNMNGDGIFVWPCYALTLVVLVANMWYARTTHARLLREIKVQSAHRAHL